jgi:hypothetical protein
MSRLDEVIAQVEKGEPVDCGHVLTLMALDVAKADERYAASAAERQDAADEQLATQLGLDA